MKKTREDIINFLNSLSEKSHSFNLINQGRLKITNTKNENNQNNFLIEFDIEVKFLLNIQKLVFIIQKKVREKFMKKLDATEILVDINVVKIFETKNDN